MGRGGQETKRARESVRRLQGGPKAGYGVRLWRRAKGAAATSFQLACGHALTATFLKERWGWIDSGQCWWRHEGREIRKHRFKERTTWKKGIRQLWEDLGRGRHHPRERPAWKSRRGFGYHARQAAARPSNTSIRDPLGNERCRETGSLRLPQQHESGAGPRGDHPERASDDHSPFPSLYSLRSRLEGTIGPQGRHQGFAFCFPLSPPKGDTGRGGMGVPEGLATRDGVSFSFLFSFFLFFLSFFPVFSSVRLSSVLS